MVTKIKVRKWQHPNVACDPGLQQEHNALVEAYEVRGLTLEEALKVLDVYQFCDGGYTNNDDVIEMMEKIRKVLNG